MTKQPKAEVNNVLTEPERSEIAQRSRKPLIAIAVVAVIGVIAGIGLLALPPDANKPHRDVKVASEEVVRGDLVEQVRANGKLTFTGLRDLGTSLGGAITAVPALGGTIGPGGELFRVDNTPVVLFRGELPMWRAFESGMSNGPDVLQLERNLRDLGFFDREPDQQFAWSTAKAIERWQKALGMDRTGSIEMGRIVFSPTDIRVAEHKASVGSPAGLDVLGVSSVNKEISAFVDPDLREIVAPGSPVTIVLPSGKEAPGKVGVVGAPVEQDDPNGGKKLKLPITISLDDPALADGLDNVTVSVILNQLKSKDALQVPVLALLARSGGGFAVEVIKNNKTHQINVELGVFAGGMVEVTGGDLKAGEKVVVGQ